MTEGLKLAGGKTLGLVLQRFTSTAPKAFFSGFATTALVQSSSAVTVSVIGFANAGMLNLSQAMWVVFGSNVGTTMTAWIVAVIGLKLEVSLVALPAIGLGALAHLFSKSIRWRALGGAIAGLGMLFFGLELMQQAFSGAADQIDLSWVAAEGVAGLLALLLLGAVLTALMQSSSAALAVVLTAVATGLLSLQAGAAAVIGANLGTTATALLAAIGATATAKRVAAAHVIFNLLAGAIALLLLGFMLLAVSAVQNSLHLDPNPAVSLAIFHTLFNLVGVLVMIPVSRRTLRFLEARFMSKGEQLSKPLYLDKATAASPDSAARALMLEENRLLESVREMLSSGAHGAELVRRIALLEELVQQVNDFIAVAVANKVSPDLADFFQRVISLNLHIADVLDNRKDLEQLDERILPEEVRAILTHGLGYLQALLEVDLMQDDAFPAAERILDEFQQKYDETNADLIRKAQNAEINMQNLQATTRYLATLRRVIRGYVKSVRSFAVVHQGMPNPE